MVSCNHRYCNSIFLLKKKMMMIMIIIKSNNNNNKLQLGCHPVAVVTLHVNKYEKKSN